MHDLLCGREWRGIFCWSSYDMHLKKGMAGLLITWTWRKAWLGFLCRGLGERHGWSSYDLDLEKGMAGGFRRRALGDAEFKEPTGKRLISNEPMIDHVDLTADDRVLVIATRSLWDALGFGENVVQIVEQVRTRHKCRLSSNFLVDHIHPWGIGGSKLVGVDSTGALVLKGYAGMIWKYMLILSTYVCWLCLSLDECNGPGTWREVPCEVCMHLHCCTHPHGDIALHCGETAHARSMHINRNAVSLYTNQRSLYIYCNAYTVHTAYALQCTECTASIWPATTHCAHVVWSQGLWS